MPGTNGGTGRPLWFHCAAFRREPYRTRCAANHFVKLTGRKRLMPIGNAGNRNSKFSREYRCACGHVGWSRHVDLEHLESNSEKI